MAKPSLEKPNLEKVVEQPSLQTNLDAYKKNIQEIKTSVDQVKQQNQSLEKDKATLAKEVLDQKQKEIDDKKTEIESKKIETLALINKIKIDMKLASLDKKVPQDVADDEKYLTDLDVNKAVAKKNFFSEQWDAVTSKEEWKDNTRKNVGRVAVGIGAAALVYKGISWLFGGHKKEKSEDKESDSKEEKPSWWKKALTWAGIGVGGSWLGRGLFTGKWDFFGWNPFSGEKKPGDGAETTPGANIESSAKEYEKLNDKEQLVYESLASNINEYYGNAMGDQAGVSGVEEKLGDSKFETKDGKKIAGLVPFVLANRYENVGAMIRERAFYYEILGIEGHILWDKMKDWSVDGLKTFLMPIAGMLDAATMKILSAATKTDEILNALKADPKAESIMRTVFRKSLSVISYFESRKRKLEYALVREYLSTKNEDGFTALSEDDKQERIADMIEDDEWYNKNIKAQVEEFTNKRVFDSVSYMKSKNILDGEIDPFIQKAVTKVEERRKDLLGIDDPDQDSTLQSLKLELKEGKLTPKGKEKLQDLCSSFESDIDNFGRKSWYNQYLPLLEMVNIDQDTLEKMQSTGDYDGVVKSYKEAIQGILKKSNQGTLTAGDLDTLEFQVNDYYKFQKSLVTTQLNLSEARDKNGDVVARWTSTFIKGTETGVKGVQMLIKGDAWDKIKGGLLVTGAAATIDVLSYPLRLVLSGANGKLAKSPTLKAAWNIGKFTIKSGAKLGEKLTGKVLRSRLPYGLGAHWYDENSLRAAVCNGELDLDRAAKIAHRKGMKIDPSNLNSLTINEPEDILRHIFRGQESKQATYSELVDLLDKYKKNPKMYGEIFQYHYEGKRYSPKDWFKLDKTKAKFTFNDVNIKRLKSIDIRIRNFTNPTEKQIFTSMMRYTKDLNQAENLAAMSIEPQYLKLFEQGADQVMSADQFGKYLAKYSGKIQANEMQSFQKFIFEAKNAGKIGKNSELFVANALRNFETLKKGNFAVSQVEVLELNASKWSRLAESTKVNTAKMIADLEKMSQNTRLKPFWKGINNQVSALKEYSTTITPDGLKAMKDISWLDSVTGFNTLSTEGIQAMSKLSYILRDTERGPKLLKLLQEKKTLDEIKAVLSAEGIEVAKIDETILSKIASTKSVSKITDIVNYGAEFKAITGFKKLISNPAMKYAGKLIGKGLIVADFVYVGYDVYTGLEESQRIKQTNLARGEWREDQVYYDAVTGGLGAIAGACMFIPGAGWIAGGALATFMVAKELGDDYYKDIEKFKQNYADFTKKELPAIKQELVSINTWGQGFDRTLMDKINLFGSVNEKTKGLQSTTTDAVRALIYLEERQNNPYAYYDLNDSAVLNNPELKIQVEDAKKRVNEVVNKRFEYIKTNYINKNKPIVDAQSYSANTGIASLNTLLEDSTTYEAMSKDSNYMDKNNVAGYKTYLEKRLKDTNAEAFAKFEHLFKTQNTQLYLLYAQLPYYRQKLTMLSTGDQLQDEKIAKNCDYFAQYMAYKLLGKSPLAFPKIDFDPNSIDCNPITDLLSTFTLSPNKLSGAEIKERGELLTDQQVLARYGVSLNLGQNILYDIAKTLSYSETNDLKLLKQFFNEGAKSIHGIYCTQDGQWAINENNGLDNDFATDSELNALDKMTYFQEKMSDAASSSFTGKMIEESSTTNKELSKKFSDIASSHLVLKKNQNGVKTEIKNYLLAHGTDKAYIQIPLDLVLKGAKAGIPNLAACVYRVDNGKILYKTTLPGIKPAL